MKRSAALLAAITFCVMCPAYAVWSVSERGTWPEGWPKELEPLREQSRSLTGSLANRTVYEIPFTDREEFEAAWPHLLKIKSEGAPVILLRPDEKRFLTVNAGVLIWPSNSRPENGVTPAGPTPHVAGLRERWLRTTFIELVVDGEIVDMNRIPLPVDSPIIDERFKDGQNKSPRRSDG